MRYSRLKRKTHCLFYLTFHVIFVTKFRYRCLNHAILSNLKSLLPELAQLMRVRIIEINGENDHIHFILETTPQDTLGTIIGALKAKSSSILHDKYKFPYWGKHARTLWSAGYFVCSTGGAPLEVIKQYIKNQGA